MLFWRDVRLFILFWLVLTAVFGLAVWQHITSDEPGTPVRMALAPSPARAISVNPVVAIDPAPDSLWTDEGE